MAKTSFNARSIPNDIDLKKCALLAVLARASASSSAAGSTSATPASASATTSTASSAVVSTAAVTFATTATTAAATATTTSSNNNEEDTGLPAPVADNGLSPRAERNLHYRSRREVALASAAAASAARAGRSASTTTMTSLDHGRDPDTSLTLANAMPSNTEETVLAVADSSVAAEASSGMDGLVNFVLFLDSRFASLCYCNSFVSTSS